MQIFEYPYIIITIMVFFLLIMGAIGIFFALKCVKTANGTVEKDFLSIKRLENMFDKLEKSAQNRCLVYIGVSLDKMSRLYSETKAMRVLSEMKPVLLKMFCADADGGISLYGEKNFIALNKWEDKEAKFNIEKCLGIIVKILANNEAINIAHVNFGYYTTRSNQVSFATAINRAKQAFTLAENKNLPYHEWDSNNGKELERKIKRENSIQNEIDNNRFFLEYQPIVDAKSEKIVGAEVLSRLNSQTDGVLTPGSFFSAVSSVGLNDKFDYYIFEKNCKWISNSKEKRENYVYAINFSRSTLCDASLSQNIINIVEKYGLKYTSLAVEILEDKGISGDEKNTLIANLKALKEKGMLILLDDFGSGYTSFADLSSFDIDIVKIDKTITQNAVNQTGFVILKNIIQTAKDLGFKTLCEGVETEEHKKVAVEAGCDILQGYYFYRPMPVKKLEDLFENEK